MTKPREVHKDHAWQMRRWMEQQIIEGRERAWNNPRRIGVTGASPTNWVRHTGRRGTTGGMSDDRGG